MCHCEKEYLRNENHSGKSLLAMRVGRLSFVSSCASQPYFS